MRFGKYLGLAALLWNILVVGFALELSILAVSYGLVTFFVCVLISAYIIVGQVSLMLLQFREYYWLSWWSYRWSRLDEGARPGDAV